MALSFGGIVFLVALLALTTMSTPTFSSVEITRRGSGETRRQTPPEDGFHLRQHCPEMFKEQMAAKIIEHVNATGKVKTVLRKSAIFVDCAAGKFCKCFLLRVPPLVVPCFGVVGGYCMTRAIRRHVAECALACVSRMVDVNVNANSSQQYLGDKANVNVNANSSQQYLLGDKAISDLCYGKCAKQFT